MSRWVDGWMRKESLASSLVSWLISSRQKNKKLSLIYLISEGMDSRLRGNDIKEMRDYHTLINQGSQ